MWATGMMDPDWWKTAALNHRWYKDEDAYADYCEATPPPGFTRKYLAVHYDGARGLSSITFPRPTGAVSFTPTETPFEVQPEEPFELKESQGNIKYKVSRITCENQTLTLTLLQLSTNQEITVTMGIAPEGFTTDLFEKLLPTASAETTTEALTTKAVSTQPSTWICPCGAENNGKFCIQCGHQRM